MFSYKIGFLLLFWSHKLKRFKQKPFLSLERGFGGSNEDRTRYLIVANDALSQMSYGPVLVSGNYNKFIFDKNQSNVISRNINLHFFDGISSVMPFENLEVRHFFRGI